MGCNWVTGGLQLGRTGQLSLLKVADHRYGIVHQIFGVMEVHGAKCLVNVQASVCSVFSCVCLSLEHN